MGKEHVIHTDGACRNNGRDNPQGAIGVHSERGSISERLPASMERHTNNMAEHAAINRGLKSAPYDNNPVVIKTDSELCQKTFGGGWAQQWERNGGRTAGGSKPANYDFVQDTMKEVNYRRSQGQDVRFEHVRGHAGDSGNQRAHDLAQQGLGQGAPQYKYGGRY
ncbi:ribonuclease H-like protein [Jaminaea rosea]|uniref:ribonuclease H n=1 Tax=Jaminaea rosea TaxID=1569628 RepID=A0A316UM50_9BASI|nr:ribonuclease H-like protein [Jaminaea rosea]PWN25888.1 ribonuclease H-like protein [Jaminaea rosea]